MKNNKGKEQKKEVNTQNGKNTEGETLYNVRVI